MIDNLFQYFVIFILFIIIYPIYKIYKSITETSSRQTHTQTQTQTYKYLNKYSQHKSNDKIYTNVENKSDIHTFCPMCKRKIKLSNYFKGGNVTCLNCKIKFYSEI